MKSEIAISVQDVSMMFNLNRDKIDSIKEYTVKLLKRQLHYEEFWALKNISFEVMKGEVFGVMGLNGAGKSTLLKIIAGVFKPTKGKVIVNGLVAPMIELGAGFDYEFSARENVFMNGAMFGHPTHYMKKKYDDIIDFAELWEFEDVPLKNLSSGMVARLAFAIATNVQPDILIADEVLGVGDYKFQEKCQNRISQMIANGATVLLVSHNIEIVSRMCTRAMILEAGSLKAIGDVAKVCQIYSEI